MSQEIRLIVAFTLVWAGLLLLSLDFRSPQFRPSDGLRDPAGPTFLPDQDVVRDGFGDLAYKNDLPRFEQPRRIHFRTDAHGYRNPPMETPPRVVVLGDSFVIGVSLDGADTVAARLTERLDEPVYNFGCYEGASIVRYEQDARFHAAPPRVVVLMLASRRVEAIQFEAAVERQGRSKVSAWARVPPLSWLLDVPVAIVNVKWPLERDNNLRHLARRTLGAVRYRIPGQLQRGQVLTVDGEEHLALTLAQQKLLLPPARRGLDRTVEGIARFRDRLEERGTKLLFAQVPEPGLIYEEAYADSASAIRPRFHDLLYEGLRERGVECVDLLPHFRAERSPYLFLHADTHWNPRCVDLAARVLVERVRPLLD